jgi:SAM-dependent methyltransferase
MRAAATFFDRTVRPLLAAGRDAGDRLLERRSGVRTHGLIELRELGLEAEGRVRYQPSPWMTLRRILPPREVEPHDVFVDFGCGLGRVLVQASRYRFARVVGVELSPELSARARENLARARSEAARARSEVVTADVLEWAVPDDVTVAYFANPFTGAIFEDVIRRLLVSVDRAPRRLRIIYHWPREHERLMATGRVRVARRLWSFRPTRAWAHTNGTYLYEVLPASPS